jgi:mRNA interferase MazF
MDKPKPVDISINEKNVEFKQTGLKLTSTIKLDKVATISKDLIVGEIGEIGPKLKKEVNRKITEIYNL